MRTLKAQNKLRIHVVRSGPSLCCSLILDSQWCKVASCGQQRFKSACTSTSMARVPVHPYLDNLEAVEGACDQRRLWSDCADAQSDLSLCWSHKSYCRFYHAMTHIRAHWRKYYAILISNYQFWLSVLISNYQFWLSETFIKPGYVEVLSFNGRRRHLWRCLRHFSIHYVTNVTVTSNFLNAGR